MSLQGQSFGGWRRSRSFRGVYTGGRMAQTEVGDRFVCLFNDDVVCVCSKTFETLFSLTEALSGSEERFISFAMNASGTKIITASENQLLRTWQVSKIEEKADAQGDGEVEVKYKVELKKSWKAHSGPVTCMDLHPLSQLVVTGSTDQTVKVWNVDGGFCTHNFRGHSSVISSVGFHPHHDTLRVASAEMTGNVRVWGLTKDVKTCELKNHMSAVTSMLYVCNGKVLLTAGRDRVVSLWNLKSDELIKMYPTHDAVEAVSILQDSALKCTVALVGDKGNVRLLKCSFNASLTSTDCKLIRQQNVLSDGVEGGSLAEVLYNKQHDALVVATWEQLILYLDPVTLAQRRQVIGHLDEITDLAMFPALGSSKAGARVALATNTNEAHIVSLSDFGSQSLKGHTNTVYGVAVSPTGDYVATCSKDSTVRVYDVETLACVMLCRGHTEAVSSVAFLPWCASRAPQLASFGADKTIKLWCGLPPKAPRPPEASGESVPVGSKRPRSESVLSVLSESSVRRGGAGQPATWAGASPVDPVEGAVKHTVLAHDKMINVGAVSPNGKLLATASQDKTVKLWDSETLALRGTLRGHKRGVWSVAFSPVEMVLASSSADKTVRLWSVTDLSCLCALEGHSSSVLKVGFVRGGSQVVSSGADGVLKLWGVKSQECAATCETEHEDRVWGLAQSSDNQLLVTGSGDSLVVWKDKIDLEKEIEAAKHEEELLAEQNLITQMRRGNNADAAILALRLNKPHTFHKIMHYVVTNDEATGKNRENEMDDFMNMLTEEDQVKLWERVTEWNTIKKHSNVAQQLLARLLERPITKKTLEVQQKFDALNAYSKRHRERLGNLLQSSYLFDHVLSCMDPVTAPEQS